MTHIGGLEQWEIDLLEKPEHRLTARERQRLREAAEARDYWAAGTQHPPQSAQPHDPDTCNKCQAKKRHAKSESVGRVVRWVMVVIMGLIGALMIFIGVEGSSELLAMSGIGVLVIAVAAGILIAAAPD